MSTAKKKPKKTKNVFLGVIQSSSVLYGFPHVLLPDQDVFADTLFSHYQNLSLFGTLCTSYPLYCSILLSFVVSYTVLLERGEEINV